MRPSALCLLVALLLLATRSPASDAAVVAPRGASAPPADVADAYEGAWFSYRDLYRRMIRFEKYGGPKQFIQSQLQLAPADKTAAIGGAQLSLRSHSVRLDLPLDALGRASFPFLKQAYDENAELRVNRPAGTVALEQQLSILTRADGVYALGDLRAACEEVLQYQRYASLLAHRLTRCVGLAFIFPKEAPATVAGVRRRDQERSSLSAMDGDAWGGNSAKTHKLVVLRFSQWPGEGQVLCEMAPLAITPILE